MIENEANLAWALAQAAKPHLDTAERNAIFAFIGGGETSRAMRVILKWIAAKRIPVQPDLVQACLSWLDSYVGHPDEGYLRRLIDGFVLPVAVAALVVSESARSTSPDRRSCGRRTSRRR